MKIIHVAVLSVIGLATGCTSINSTSFDNMSSVYRQAVEEYGNNNILLNIVRASKDMPMSFLDMPSVIGTGQVTATAGVSATQSAGTNSVPPSITGGSLGLTVNNGFTFSQGSLDNAQFMSSFLKEIPLGVLGFRGTERLMPKAVTYSLLIESVEFHYNNAVVRRFNNDPLDPNYADFQQVLYTLIEAGLTVENATFKTPIGPAFESSHLSKSLDSWGAPVIDGLSKGSLSFEKVKVKGRELYQLTRNDVKTRACVNKFRSEQLMGNLLGESAFCQDTIMHPRTDEKYTSVMRNLIGNKAGNKTFEMVIGIRSPGNTFDFLGAVVNAQFGLNGAKEVMIQPSSSVIDSYNQHFKAPHALFKVYKNENISNPVASVSYKGVTYALSDDDDSYSKQVMEFMSTLISVAKIPGAIPQSPAVIVR